ncbi:glycine cleavage system protein R [Yunchengibacter salinarum]|uniref:glycine cleavage system protein R n=1 Tax=Yunchengibacter salinarum TaxID=3133399 RepID=UPI0035B60EE9
MSRTSAPSPSRTMLISIKGADRTGVVADVSGCLFEMGANLADSSFALLGQGFEFSALGSFPTGVTEADVQSALASLSALAGAHIRVSGYDFAAERGPRGQVTHRLVVSGGDRPGLVACISEIVQEAGANIVRMSSGRRESETGAAYITRFALHVPPEGADRLARLLDNTAGGMGLVARMEPVRPEPAPDPVPEDE